MIQLIREYIQSGKDYRASLKALYREFPSLSRRELRRAVRDEAHAQYKMEAIK